MAEAAIDGAVVAPGHDGQAVLVVRLRLLEHQRVLVPARALLPPAAVVVDRVVPGERHQPGAEGPVRLAVLVERLVHLDEDLLRQVLGLVRLSREAIGEAEDFPRVGADELPPGSFVAATAPRQEVGVARGQKSLEARSIPATRGNAPAGRGVHLSCSGATFCPLGLDGLPV